MTKRQTDLAFELADSWHNGNRSHVIAMLKQETAIVAAAIAFQIASCLEQPESLDNADFPNAIDRHAGEYYG